jgi:hypothetical protein
VTRQIRMLGLSALAAVAVGVVVSASASAHAYFVCMEGGTEKFTEHLCAAKGETGKWSWTEANGTYGFKVEGTSGTSKLEGEVAGDQLSINCGKDSFIGEIGKGSTRGKGEGEYTFSECKAYVGYAETKGRESKLLTACVIPTISFKVIEQLVTGQGSGVEDEFRSNSGVEGLLVKVKLQGAECALKGTYNLEDDKGAEVEIGGQAFGGMVCALPEAAVGKVEHEVVCPSTGSHLTFNAKPASFFSTETAKLAGGASWAAE